MITLLSPAIVVATLLLMASTTKKQPQRASDSQIRKAAGSQSLEKLQQAISTGWTANDINKQEGKSALHMAAWKGSLENLRYLVETVGCDIDAYSRQEFSYGKTAIFFAATQSRPDVVEYLLHKLAKVTIVNNKGQSVLSIAASHEIPLSILEQIQAQEIEQGKWWNFRRSHSDGFEYGDLDPRFLDRPLRDTDTVTEFAVNPTTKATRKGGFLRKNPQAARELRAKEARQQQRSKTTKKKAIEPALTQQEQEEWDLAWKTLDSYTLPETSDIILQYQQALLQIVTLGDKHRCAWIPDTVTKLQERLGKELATNLVERTMDSDSNTQNPRRRELFQKLLMNLSGKRSSVKQQPSKRREKAVVAASISSFDEEPWKTFCKDVQPLGMTWLHSPGYQILRLPEPPEFINKLDQLAALYHQLKTCLIVAIDTEWCDLEDNTVAVSTLQLSYVQSHDTEASRIATYVVDLRVQSDEEYHRLAREMVCLIFETKDIIVLGFALGHDVPLLEIFVGAKLAVASSLDLQLVFAEGAKSLPGLKSCVARYSSSLPLSKEQQCSNWTQRPLTQAQLEYAGLDAAILLILLAEYRRNKARESM